MQDPDNVLKNYKTLKLDKEKVEEKDLEPEQKQLLKKYYEQYKSKYEEIIANNCKIGTAKIQYTPLVNDIKRICSKNQFNINKWTIQAKDEFIVVIANVAALWSLLQLRISAKNS